MTLAEIRKWVVAESGRYDLIEPSGANNGIDRYINAASKWLDRLTEKHEDISRVYRTMSAGEYFVTFQECRAILKVGISDQAKFYGWLEKFTLDELKTQCQFTKPFGDVTAGVPVAYAPAFLRLSDTSSADYTDFSQWVNNLADWQSYNGIIILPPTDREYLIEVWGKFFSSAMSLNDDENFWSIAEPQILVKAVLRELEVFNRNTQGQQDWELAIRAELFDMEKDFVEQNIHSIDQMGG